MAATAADGSADLMAAANRAYRQGEPVRTEEICKQILTRTPAHAGALNLLGLVHQGAGRQRLAVKLLAKAIAADESDAGFHYNIACSYQLLSESAAAAAHFNKAIALGLNGRTVEEFIGQNQTVIDCIKRLPDGSNWPQGEYDFGTGELAAIARDIFLRCALKSTMLCSLPLEMLLTHLRRRLLRLALSALAGTTTEIGDDTAAFFCALAQQCFINEYVFARTEAEDSDARQAAEALVQQSARGQPSPLLLAAVAAYFPLHSLAYADALLDRQWPFWADDLVRQQVREPLQEVQDRGAIAVLTPIDDDVSLRVMQQYEENPYPRWTLHPFAALADDNKRRAAAADAHHLASAHDILIAGCGTGKHAIRVAQLAPRARILAVDISRASLAYARRKTREGRLRNIEYAQADILKIAAIGRSFDRIEAVGVLHHLADPKAGWRALLALLRPNGIMRVGLYSETGRRAYADAFALIAERGYRPSGDDIRALRETVIRNAGEPRWRVLIDTVDFYSMSGCRDLLFNVMEHRFTIPEIARFLEENALAFLGFELDPAIAAKFARQYPAAHALTDLECWNAFEAVNPNIFLQMYRFSILKLR